MNRKVMKRTRAALRDPEVLALMRRDPQFDQFFDADGNLNVDTRQPRPFARLIELWSKR